MSNLDAYVFRFRLSALSARALLIVLVSALCGLASDKSFAANPDEVVVIVPSKSPVDRLSKTGLRAIFGMRSRTWPHGGVIKVYVLADDDPVHAVFSKQVLQTFPFNLRRIWDRRVYSGTGQAPIIVKTEEEMHEKISRTESSIGYITRDKVAAGVKVVELR